MVEYYTIVIFLTIGVLLTCLGLDFMCVGGYGCEVEVDSYDNLSNKVGLIMSGVDGEWVKENTDVNIVGVR